MPRPFNFSRFIHPNDSRWEVQIIKLLIICFTTLPCYLVLLRAKYNS
jgi:hypothetical protein